MNNPYQITKNVLQDKGQNVIEATAWSARFNKWLNLIISGQMTYLFDTDNELIMACSSAQVNDDLINAIVFKE
jgi:hypothetical protein